MLINNSLRRMRSSHEIKKSATQILISPSPSGAGKIPWELPVLPAAVLPKQTQTGRTRFGSCMLRGRWDQRGEHMVERSSRSSILNHERRGRFGDGEGGGGSNIQDARCKHEMHECLRRKSAPVCPLRRFRVRFGRHRVHAALVRVGQRHVCGAA